MKVLMVSRYVQPDGKLFNGNVYRQAKSLSCDHGVDINILTWPFNDGWTGPVPNKSTGMSCPPQQVEAGGLTFHVVNPPEEWNDRPLQTTDWGDAVDFGVRVLLQLRPDIVHLQHWSGLWWFLESAQRLGIPTVYTNHDWGMACLRTTLVMGDGSLCDGKVVADKCAYCIWQGRGFIGKVNEIVVQGGIGQKLVRSFYQSPLKGIFKKYGGVKLPVQKRVDLNLSRAKSVLGKLDAMFTPSSFGRTFYAHLGVPEERIQVHPWYHDPAQTRKSLTAGQPFTITYIGRVSPEKGVHLIFEAMSRITNIAPIHLRIVGANTSPYCLRLRKRYSTRVGAHTVEWLGWSEVEPLFLTSDVSIIPSTWIDNTPLSLIEALRYKVPVIATRVPPVEELVSEGQNGYLAEYNSVESLSAAIQRAVQDKEKIRSDIMQFPLIRTCREYTRVVKETYRKISGQ